MTITLGLLVTREFQVSLGALMNMELPSTAAWTVVLVADRVATELKNYEAAQKALVAKYSQETDRSGYAAEHAALLQTPVEIAQIPFSALNGKSIKPAALAILLQSVISPPLAPR